MNDNVVALAAIMLLFGGPIVAVIVTRAMSHQERIAMIRAGMIPPPEGFAGIGWGKKAAAWQVPPSAPPPSADAYNAAFVEQAFYAQAQLAKGIRVTLVGVALLIGLSFISRGYFGPWMLFGLIPMFVGIAQIITALIAGARFSPQEPVGGGAQPQPGFYAGPPPGQAAPPPASGPPYGWRPGPTPEIEKPAGPPDLR